MKTARKKHAENARPPLKSGNGRRKLSVRRSSSAMQKPVRGSWDRRTLQLAPNRATAHRLEIVDEEAVKLKHRRLDVVSHIRQRNRLDLAISMQVTVHSCLTLRTWAGV